MASFNQKINNCARLDWRVLMGGSISLYYDSDILKKDLRWLEKEGYQLYTLDFHIIRTREEFHKKAKACFGFPDYYGENLSAFSDCLMSDFSIREEGGAVVILEQFDEYYRTDEIYAHEILERLELNSRRQMLFGNRFFTLIQIEDTNTLIREVGQHSVVWNLHEWRQRNISSTNNKYN